jgi:hypothetical protein
MKSHVACALILLLPVMVNAQGAAPALARKRLVTFAFRRPDTRLRPVPLHTTCFSVYDS